MADVTERFLRYVAVDTQSEDEQEAFPSTEKQKNLGRMLKEELEALGVSDVRMDDYGYVYGCLPANTEKKIPGSGIYLPYGYSTGSIRCQYSHADCKKL